MSTTYVWSRLEDEPIESYFPFSQYFLALGPNRSMLKAYRAYVAIETPEKIKEDGIPSNTPTIWSEWADKYDWLERAMAYDEMMFSDDGVVELARQMLKNSTLVAAVALRKALDNPRQSVAAAKEILDRSGVLAATVQINAEAPFTADEMAAAAKEIAEWEENAKNG